MHDRIIQIFRYLRFFYLLFKNVGHFSHSLFNCFKVFFAVLWNISFWENQPDTILEFKRFVSQKPLSTVLN